MKKITIILLIIGFVQVADAQVAFRSLQDVLNYADSHAIAIQSATVQQRADEARQQQSNAYLYPTVNAVAGYNDNITIQSTLVPNKLFNPNASDDEYTEMTFGKQHLYNAGIQAQWDILNFQRIFAAKTASLAIEAGKRNTEQVKFKLYNQLASAYYSILLTQKSVDIYTENVAITEVLLENTREKYAKGIVSEEDLNRVTMQHIQNENNLEYVQNNLQQLYKQFQSQLNTGDEIAVSGNIDSDLIVSTEMTAVNPEIAWQQTQVEASESKLNQSKALFLPSLSFQYQYNYNWSTNDFMNLSGANKLPAQYFGVRLNVPIFSGLSSTGKVKESKAELKLQQLQLENLRQTKANEDETLKLQFTQSANSLGKMEQILALQTTNDAHSNNKYESGIISLDERMDKYKDLLSAQYNYLQGLTDYSIAQYKIYIRQMNFNTNN